MAKRQLVAIVLSRVTKVAVVDSESTDVVHGKERISGDSSEESNKGVDNSGQPSFSGIRNRFSGSCTRFQWVTHETSVEHTPGFSGGGWGWCDGYSCTIAVDRKSIALAILQCCVQSLYTRRPIATLRRFSAGSQVRSLRS